MNNVTPIFGLVLIVINLISAFSIFSQIRLTHHRKNTAGVSWVPYTMGMTNALAGLVYSLLIHDLPFIMANFAWSLGNGTMVFLLLHYRRTRNSESTSA